MTGAVARREYPLIVEAIARLKVTSIVIDGEAMCFTGAMHDFDKLWNRSHDHVRDGWPSRPAIHVSRGPVYGGPPT